MSTDSSIAGRLLAVVVVTTLLCGTIGGVATGATAAGASPTDGTALSLDDSVDATDSTLENTTESVENATDGTDDDLENATDETTDSLEETTNATVDERTDTVDDTASKTTETIDSTVNETADSIEGTVNGTTVAGSIVLESERREADSSADGNGSTGSGSDSSSDESNAGTTDGSGDDPGTRSDSETATDAVLVGLLGAITASGAAAGGTGASGAAGGAGTAATGWLRQLRHVGRIRHAAADLPWKLLPVFRYSRYDDSDPLEHDRRQSIYEAIQERPGRYLAAVSDRTDIPLSTVRYHVRILEEEDLVTGRKVNGKRRYFLEDADAELQAALAEPAKRALLETLSALERAPNGRLAEALDRDPSTISHHLAALEEEGLVVREKEGRSVVNELAPRVEVALSGPEAEAQPVPADD